MTRCTEGLSNDFASNYKTIAQVTVAIIIRLVVEALFMRDKPRDLLMRQTEELCKITREAYASFFEGNMTHLKECEAQAKAQYAKCAALAPQCSVQLEVCPGIRARFNLDLYNSFLEQMHLLLDDLAILVLSTKRWRLVQTDPEVSNLQRDAEQASKESKGKLSIENSEKSRLFELMAQQASFKSMEADLLQSLDLCFLVVEGILNHDDEGPLHIEGASMLEHLHGIRQLDGALQFYTDVNVAPEVMQASDEKPIEEGHNAVLHNDLTSCTRTRISVAVSALRSACTHAGDIGILCLQQKLT